MWFKACNLCVRCGCTRLGQFRRKQIFRMNRLSSTSSTAALSGEIDRYQGVTVDVNQLEASISESQFREFLTDSLDMWRLEKRTAVWLRVPIMHSKLISVAAFEGFSFHHAENDFSMLKLWLDKSSPDMLPRFATHQVGVSGVVLREDTEEVLVVQDKNRTHTAWKFPGGLADLGEDIAVTAVREVAEETGIHSEFQSFLTFRQQHDQPGAFGRSDIYVVCRLRPLTFEINPCQTEILRCQWMKPMDLYNATTTPITRRLSKLILFGMKEGFDKIDITCEQMKSIYKGLTYKLFHRPLPKEYGDT